MRSFSAKELQQATDNYNRENRITSCNFEGYKGCLEGRVVFVKKYVNRNFGDPEMVSNEISVASQLSGHKNSLKLLGCCLETQSPTLVFEFPINRNLEDQLRSNPSSLPWKSRLKIANEIASVITYLHTAFPRPIIHRDIKPRNFYLDKDLCAKISDFILCMALPEGETQVEDDPCGTIGYLAPEAMSMGVYSEKSDVFGFGSLLFYLLTGKGYGDFFFFSIPNVFKDDREEDCVFERMQSYIRNHGMNEIVDPTILAEGGGVPHHHQFQAVLQLFLECHRMNAEERPIMLDVAKQLKRIQRGDFIFDGVIRNDGASSSYGPSLTHHLHHQKALE